MDNNSSSAAATSVLPPSEISDDLIQVLAATKAEIRKVIIGQDDVIDKALIVIITGSHGLIEGVPGVAKTLLVRTLAKVLGCDFGRIQFTPDLMPTDITGTNIYNMKTNEFVLLKGPVFTTFLLGDEINRAPAKTQAALLQAMQERCVSIDRETYALSPAFTVFATQNPVEYEGTYPLPEAQKDRFLLKITMDCPNREHELTLARRMLAGEAPEQVLAAGQLQQVLSSERLAAVQQQLQRISFRDELLGYVVDVVQATRRHPDILIGAGPRATQALVAAARAQAVLAGRDFVTPDDVKALAIAVLGHRIVLRPEQEIEGLEVAEVISRVLQEVSVPR